jgi:(1->4)-alpha-D-glucan 1-alpha-D-glucosylmutase
VITYRLQLDKDFAFDDAVKVLNYLDEPGVTHLYLSPILQARKGGTHGYDVYDFSKVNEELGGEKGFRRLATEAKKRGLGIVVDIVPNHMALENPYFLDALKEGRYSKFFDVNWSSKVMLPILGDSANLEVKKVGGEFFLKCYDTYLPLRERTAEKVGCRDEECMNARLEEVLDYQFYELANWKDSSKRTSYRRLFDVNGLIGVRQEDEEVFEETHRKVFQLVDEGLIDGLRVDHVDGLFNPKEYLGQAEEEVRGRQVLGSGEDLG